MRFASSSNVLTGNIIGADTTATQPIGNALSGVCMFFANDNRIGGLLAGEANIIAFNIGASISIDNNSQPNALLSNSIFNNGLLWIAHLADNSVKVNDPLDAETRSNALQNYPTVTVNRHLTVPNFAVLNGEPNSLASTSFMIQAFTSDTPVPSGFGEGKHFAGSTTITTDEMRGSRLMRIVMAMSMKAASTKQRLLERNR